MKRLIIAAFFCAFASLITAQEQRETFERNSWNWQETATKKNSTIIQDGYLVITSKKGSNVVTTRFPMNVQRNFKMIAKILLPKYDKKSGLPVFGIVFDAAGTDAFLIMPNLIGKNKTNNKKMTLFLNGERQEQKMPFNANKKNAEVIITVESRGGKLSIDVDGMTVFTDMKAGFKTSDWGFVVGGGEIKVDEIIINQVAEEEY